MPARIPWVLRDPQTSDEYLWDINPNEFSLPYTKSLTYKSSAAPDGKTLVFEGRDEVQDISFSGVILTEAQYEELIVWFNKRYQLELEDDLGRTFFIYFTSFNMTRKRSTQHPWRHEYNGNMVIVDWAA